MTISVQDVLEERRTGDQKAGTHGALPLLPRTGMTKVGEHQRGLGDYYSSHPDIFAAALLLWTAHYSRIPLCLLHPIMTTAAASAGKLVDHQLESGPSRMPRKAVVVGAGPVGCLAALALAKAVWRVHIFEGRPGAYPYTAM